MPQIVNAVLSTPQLHPPRPARAGEVAHPPRAGHAARRRDARSSPGSEVNDNPFAPISKLRAAAASRKPATTRRSRGSDREQRYVEKLATPDVTIADIIGDVDPIKAARGGHVLSDELTIHYGMLPRANRGIFALNELPDLAGKVQVGLVQHHAGRRRPDQRLSRPPPARRAALLHGESRGLHRARQDHHAAQGSHRQRDHHALPRNGRDSAWRSRSRKRGPSRGSLPVRVPDFIAEVVERVAFEARTDKRIDKRSGVSQRMPITVLENVVSNAERRAVRAATSAGGAAHLRHLRGAARDHRQDRARVRGRARRRPGRSRAS